MKIEYDRKTNTHELDFTGDLILTTNSTAISMTNQIFTEDTTRLSIQNLEFIHVKHDSKLRIFWKILKHVYKLRKEKANP